MLSVLALISGIYKTYLDRYIAYNNVLHHVDTITFDGWEVTSEDNACTLEVAVTSFNFVFIWSQLLLLYLHHSIRVFSLIFKRLRYGKTYHMI